MATSYGRDVKLDGQEPNSLEQHPGVQRYFAEANQNDSSQGAEAEQGRGSQMVEQDRPEPVLKPDPVLAAAQDRETFNNRWASEATSSREEIMRRYQQSLLNHDRSEDSELSV